MFELVDDCIKRKPSKEEKNFANEKLSGIKERETQYEHTVLTKPTVNMNVEKEVKDAPRTPNVSEKGKTRVDVYYFDHGNSALVKSYILDGRDVYWKLTPLSDISGQQIGLL